MKTRCTHGKAKWERSENVVEWKYAPEITNSSFCFACLVLILHASLLFCMPRSYSAILILILNQNYHPRKSPSVLFFRRFSASFYYSGAYDRIARFAGGQEYSFSGEAELSSETNRKAWSRPPIGMEFSIVMFTSSGLLVRYLKVIEKSGYR